MRPRQQPTRRLQPIRVERGHLYYQGGVFSVGKIAGTQLLKMPTQPDGPGSRPLRGAVILEILGVLTVVAFVGAFIQSDLLGAWFDHPESRGAILLFCVAFVLLPAGVVAAAYTYQKRHPEIDFWYILDIHIGNRVLEVSSWDIQPLRAIQVDIAAAQNDLSYWGPMVQVNQVIGDGNAANFGGRGNSAKSA